MSDPIEWHGMDCLKDSYCPPLSSHQTVLLYSRDEEVPGHGDGGLMRERIGKVQILVMPHLLGLQFHHFSIPYALVKGKMGHR